MFSIPETGHTRSKQPSEFLCKNLTASDTSTHGGFSMPRRAAEKLFPPLVRVHDRVQLYITRQISHLVFNFPGLFNATSKSGAHCPRYT